MLTRYTILDFETVTAPDAAQWLPPITPDGRLTDPTKIADDIAKKRAGLLEMAAVDADLCQVVCAGLVEHDGTEIVMLALEPRDERAIYERVWRSINATTPMLGYGVSWFDAGVLLRRSQLLGVKVPSAFYAAALNKFRHKWIVELGDYLTLNGMIEQKKGRGLEYHCKRFGIQVEDAHTGADVAALWTAKNYEGIRAHCQADLTRIRLLAEHLDVIAPVADDPTVEAADVAEAVL